MTCLSSTRDAACPTDRAKISAPELRISFAPPAAGGFGSSGGRARAWRGEADAEPCIGTCDLLAARSDGSVRAVLGMAKNRRKVVLVGGATRLAGRSFPAPLTASDLRRPDDPG